MTLMALAVFPVKNATVPMKVKFMLLVPLSHLNADHGNTFFFLMLLFLGALPEHFETGKNYYFPLKNEGGTTYQLKFLDYTYLEDTYISVFSSHLKVKS